MLVSHGNGSVSRLRTTAALRLRLWALLLIGIGHALLLWPGDVLSTYAILGLGMAWFAGAPAPGLRRWLFGAYLFAALLYGVLGAAMMMQWASPPRPVVESTSSFAQTSLMAALALHPREFLERGITQTLAPDFWAHVIFWHLGRTNRCTATLPRQRNGRAGVGACIWRGATLLRAQLWS